MKTKKDFLTKLLTLLLVGSLFACSDDDKNNTSAVNPTADEFDISSANTGVTFNQEAVILGVNGNNASDITVSLMYLLSDIKQTVTDNTKLLIVPELSSKYENDIKKVYENGGVIAVTNPSQSQISKWFEEVDWANGFLPVNIDDALMFSFGQGFHCCVVYGPDNQDVLVDSADVAKMQDKDSEGFIFKPLLEAQEPVVAEDVASSDKSSAGADIWTDYETSMYPVVYTYLSSWVEAVNKSFSEKDVDDEEETAKMKQLFSQQVTRANGGKASNDVSMLFSKYPYSVVLPFTANEEIREVLWSDADRIRGYGSVTINLNVYQIHCYDEAPGAGDYYLVNMSAGLASENMYRGKWVNKHGGVWVRLCGYYAKSFAVDCLPWNTDDDKPFTNDDVETIGTPSPETTEGQTVYTTESSFSLNVGASVSIGKNMKSTDANPNGKGFLNGGVTISGGWSWTDSKSRNISDTDISNTSGSYAINGISQPISKVGWKMRFNNLPYFQWSQSCGINEGSSQTYRSTNYLDASWIWHAKNVKDNSKTGTIGIKVRTQASYGTLSFFTTKADLDEKTFNKFGNFEHVFFMKSFSHERCGTLDIENDFEDGTAITSVEIYKIVSELNPHKLVWSSQNTIVPGKSITSAALNTADTYMIFFKTNTGKTYKYSKKSTGKTIELGSNNIVYSSIDFEEINKNQ